MTVRSEAFPTGILLLQPEGRINSLKADSFCAEALRAIVATDHDVIMDSAGIIYISSAGLRAVLQIARTLNAEGRGFHICNLRPHIQTAFTIIGFHRIMALHPDMESAVAALQSERESR